MHQIRYAPLLWLQHSLQISNVGAHQFRHHPRLFRRLRYSIPLLVVDHTRISLNLLDHSQGGGRVHVRPLQLRLHGTGIGRVDRGTAVQVLLAAYPRTWE